MKNVLLLIFSLFLCEIGFAQLPVTDAAANASLGVIQGFLQDLNQSMREQKQTSYSNKIENYKQRILGKDNFNFVQQVESYMWKADEFIKKGQDIQMIYDKEEDILNKLKIIKRNAYKYGNLDGNISSINAFSETIKGTLSGIGNMVSEAQSVLGDKNTRMSTEGRREVLKETLSKLIIIERSLDNLITRCEMVSISNEAIEKRKEKEEEINNSMEIFKRYNEKKRRK